MEQPQWLDKNEYPFTSRYFTKDAIAQHYIDEGEGETLLFIHGTPSWSFDFRNVIKRLSITCRCVAIDHVGFGLSQKPYDYDYSLKQHVERLIKFIDALKLDNLTLVLHDFGGPIGLAMAMQMPERIRRLVILNSWIGDHSTDPDFIRLRRILKSPVLPFLYLYLNFSPRYLLPKSFGKRKLAKPILKHFTSPFNQKHQRYGVLAFAHSLINDQSMFGELWSKRSLLNSKPMLLIWGMDDQFASPKYLTQFKLGFPHATCLALAGCGHFPQEEEHERVTEGIRYFMKT
jgi:pimeloyl-ACP methyl ester carboxylesterase